MISVFILGLIIGSQINRAVYRLAWNRRSIGPWSAPHQDVPPRSWLDRLPVIGWFTLSREEQVHGSFYWLRPMLIELAMAVGLATLYQWEIDGGLHTWNTGHSKLTLLPDPFTIHVQFMSHVILISLMVAATFIDLDEKTIPDGITIPGTLIGLIWAAVFPMSLLPSYHVLMPTDGRAPQVQPDVVNLCTPFDWSPRLNGWEGLLIGLACLIAWWYARLPKTIWFRQGFVRGARYLWASMLRHPMSKTLTLMIVPCLLVTGLAWWWNGTHWQGLLTALVGVAFGGGLVWAFRFVASTILRQEALGFGDVTLMGMIGAYMGWQAALLIFFLAPLAGVVIAVIQWFLTKRHEIAYGPYLSLATLLLILNWNSMWDAAGHYFILGPWIPLGLLSLSVRNGSYVEQLAVVQAPVFVGGRQLAGQRWIRGRWGVSPGFLRPMRRNCGSRPHGEGKPKNTSFRREAHAVP